MDQPDRRQQHHVLHVGYALIGVVLVLLVLALNSALDRSHLHKSTIELASRVQALKSAHDEADKLLRQQMLENSRQDQLLHRQRLSLRQQQHSIARLSRLREQDSHALTGLHNELAVQYTDDASVKNRLHQLEANNAAAQKVIQATPAPPPTPPAAEPGHP